jgi:hypothetical protein
MYKTSISSAFRISPKGKQRPAQNIEFWNYDISEKQVGLHIGGAA